MMFFWWLADVILAADGKIMQENRKRIKSFCNLRERGPLVTLLRIHFSRRTHSSSRFAGKALRDERRPFRYQAVPQQDGQRGSVLNRPANVGFHQPVEVN